MINEVNIKSTLKERGICVIIPTYNNENTIESVVNEVLLYCDDIIVVNDGSTDKTPTLLSKIDNIVVVNSIHNKGKGNALKRGFKEAFNWTIWY